MIEMLRRREVEELSLITLNKKHKAMEDAQKKLEEEEIDGRGSQLS